MSMAITSHDHAWLLRASGGAQRRCALPLPGHVPVTVTPRDHA
jgi:hypothetical protein